MLISKHHLLLLGWKKTVKQNQQVRIDFLGAVSEMEKLDYTFEKNFIGFQNCSTGEYVQLVRLGCDSWYADVPINDRSNWEGYLWGGYGNTKSITDMLKLFLKKCHGLIPYHGR